LYIHILILYIIYKLIHPSSNTTQTHHHTTTTTQKKKKKKKKKRWIGKRLIDGLHSDSCAQFQFIIYLAYYLHLNRGNNVNFEDTGNVVAGKEGLCEGEELLMASASLMGYKIGFWNGIHKAQKW